MAKLLAMPEQAVVSGFKGVIDFYEYMGIPVARKWPRSPGHKRSPAVEAQWPVFTDAVNLWNQLSEEVKETYRKLASGTGMSGRDLFIKGYIGGLLVFTT